jgi:aspartyl-tRNA(Asn)/glutamyl-tRNA(Gln) amidotransferase subunit C
MIVDDALVDKLADLSKLEFDKEGKEAIKSDLSKILSFMEKLNELNTDGVEPLVYINEEANVFRKDVVDYPISKEEALMNAPLKDKDYIKVPKFVKGTKYQ